MDKRIIRPQSAGRVNQIVVFQEIRSNGPISRAEIARRTSLSKPSVSRAVNILLKQNLVVEETLFLTNCNNKAGRKPDFLRLNPNAAYFESIDIGGTKIRFALADLSGKILGKDLVKNPGTWGKIVDLIVSYIRQSFKNINVPMKMLKGVAIAAQGVVNVEEKTVCSAPNIAGEDTFPLGEKLESCLSVPIWVENDVNLEALGEFWKAKKKYINVVYISLGTVIGGAIILDGRIFRGTSFYAGEIGWFIPGKDYLFKKSGKFGCLESIATGPAITRRTLELLEKSAVKDDFLASKKNLNPKVIFEAYKKGSTLAKRVVDDWIENLGIAISNISSLLDPEVIILNGGLTRSENFFLEKLSKIVKWGTQRPPEVKISGLQDQASLYGGIKLCLDHYIKTLSTTREKWGATSFTLR